MHIHKFVDGNKPIMVFIHGFLTPWQVWTTQIEMLKEKYDIYAVALNAHTEDVASEFISVASEAREIVQYFKSNSINTLDVLCGISLGGKISHEIWKNGELNIRCLVLDGAPLVKCPRIAVGIMMKNYLNIIRRSKQREAKTIENFKRYFLPEKYLESYLKIADKMTDSSVKNIVNTVFSGGDLKCADKKSKILFIHGTRGNEWLSKRSAKLMKKYCPETNVICFKGDAHCYKAIYEPEKWVQAVSDFLDKHA